MVSTTLQVSLVLREVILLKAEADRQMLIAMHEKEDAIAKGEKEPKLTVIGPATVATQIIRRALPGLEVKIEKDKKGRLKK